MPFIATRRALLGGTSLAYFTDLTQGSLPAWLTYTRASQATAWDASGNLVYGPNNLALWSEQLDNAAWVPSGVTVAPNATTAPDGTLSAELIVPTATSSTFKELQQNMSSPVAGQIYQYSGSFKAAGYRYLQIVASGVNFGTVAWNIDLQTGIETQYTAGTSTVLGRGIVSQGNGWYRVWISIQCISTGGSRIGADIVPLATSNRGDAWTGDGTSGIYYWGIQYSQITAAQQSSAVPYNKTTSAAYYGPRFTYDPTSHAALGLLANEPTRTNGVRNNTMQGAVVGTPGTLPTNWSSSAFASVGTVVGTGSESGIAYIDLRMTGSASVQITFEAVQVITAANGQTWTSSLFARLVAGSYTNLTTFIRFRENAGANGLINHDAPTFVATNAALGTQRQTYTVTNNQATTDNVFPALLLSATGSYDITLRIGLPSAIQQGAALSPIPTYGSALAVSADPVQFTAGTAATNLLLADAFTAIIEGIPAASNNSTALDIGPTSNDTLVALGASGNLADFVLNGGTPVLSGNAYTPGQTIRMGITRTAAGLGSVCLNGGTVVNGGPVTAVGRTNAYLGSSQGTSGYWGGTMTKVALYQPIGDSTLKQKCNVGAAF